MAESAPRTAVVTGANAGLGRMIARALRDYGFRVFGTCRAGGATDDGIEMIEAALDTPAGCSAVAAAVRAAGVRRLHVLVNNAAVTAADDSLDPDAAPWSAWKRIFAVNAQAPLALTVMLADLLEAAASDGDPARVVMISTTSALVVPPYPMVGYTSSKAALNHATKHLAAQLAPRGITVNAIAAGPFASDSKRSNPAALAAIAERVPLARVGAFADIAGCIRFLVSSAGAFMTGGVLPLDGGLSVRASL